MLIFLAYMLLIIWFIFGATSTTEAEEIENKNDIFKTSTQTVAWTQWLDFYFLIF